MARVYCDPCMCLREMQVLYLEVLLPNPKVNFFRNCSAGICLTWNDFNCFSLLQFALSLSQSSVIHLTQAVFVIAACTQPVTIQCHPYWVFQFYYSVPSKLKLCLSLQLVLSLSLSSAIHLTQAVFVIAERPHFNQQGKVCVHLGHPWVPVHMDLHLCCLQPASHPVGQAYLLRAHRGPHRTGLKILPFLRLVTG